MDETQFNEAELVLIKAAAFGLRRFRSTAAHRDVQVRLLTDTPSPPEVRRALRLRVIGRLSLLVLSPLAHLTSQQLSFSAPVSQNSFPSVNQLSGRD